MQTQKVYTPDEIAERGTSLYETGIRQVVEADNINRFLAIDVATGEYAIADDRYEAAMTVRAKCPEAQIWGVRIGHKVSASYGVMITRATK
jgi:hypothetical protein